MAKLDKVRRMARALCAADGRHADKINYRRGRAVPAWHDYREQAKHVVERER